MGRFHSWDEGIATLKAESLECIKFVTDVLVEAVSPENSIKECEFHLCWNWLKLPRFNFLPDPVALCSARDVHVFNANFLAICIAQGVSELS